MNTFFGKTKYKLLVLSLIIGVVATLYMSSIERKLDFVLSKQNGHTLISSEHYNFSLIIEDECEIILGIDRKIISDYRWAGNIECQSYDDSVMITEADFIGNITNFEEIDEQGKFMTRTDEEIWDVAIFHDKKQQKVTLGGYIENGQIKQDIINSIRQLDN